MRIILPLSIGLLGIVLTAQAAEITLLPAKTTLVGTKATQRLIVEARQDGTFAGEVSGKPVFVSSNPQVAKVDPDGTVRAVHDGTARITATENGRKATATVTVTGTKAAFAWNFRNHVLPVLTKNACNSGACHGAAAGKGGLKLTLRGYDPDADYAALTRQAMGRRVVAGESEKSLLLLKPTMKIAHGGGRRIDPQSRDYTVLSSWIDAGAPRPHANDPRPQSLEVFPDITRLAPGATQQVLVRAVYSDGHREDVTRWVKFGTNDTSVATVDDFGKVTMQGHGEAAITVWFSSKVTFARVVSPFSQTAHGLAPHPGLPPKNRGKEAKNGNLPSPVLGGGAGGEGFIDRLVAKKLAILGLPASPRCTDNAFIRRAFLDTAGILPTEAEVTRFVADPSPDKRTRLVDALLARPEFVDYWTYRWSDLLLVSSRKLPGNALQAFSNWIRQSVQENKPWNAFVREILTAKGSTLENGAANFYLLHKEPIDLTETTTQAFMGMSLMCARCHNHPLEKWTQRDYYQMANLMARVKLKNGEQTGDVLVLASDEGDINFPRLGAPLPPRPLDGPQIALTDSRDRRQILADWLTSPDNPYFAKALVNRVWRAFMGRGLVEAEDDLRLINPPTNQELFDALAADFVKNGYDIKRLMRLILLSESYQRSADPVPGNEKDDRYYSHYPVRRLPAEVILDALSQVTAAPTEFTGFPKGFRALQLPDSQVASYFLTAFGRPERINTCACERQQEPSVAQALHLANGDTVNQKLRATGNVIDHLLDTKVSDAEVLKQLYLAALSRKPSAEEQRRALAALADSKPAVSDREARRAILEDLYWAVLTGKEFLFNH